MPDLDRVLRALAHPARRAIVEHLADGPEDAGELADLVWTGFHLMQPSTSNHLHVLREAGIVRSTRWDTLLVHELRPGSLDEFGRWAERCVAPAPTTRPERWFTNR